MIAKMTAAGWSWIASPWILGTKKLFSICWTRVEQERRDDRGWPSRCRQQHRRHRRDDRADDRHELENARDDRQEHGVATEDRVDQLAQDEQPDEGEDPDDDPED